MVVMHIPVGLVILLVAVMAVMAETPHLASVGSAALVVMRRLTVLLASLTLVLEAQAVLVPLAAQVAQVAMLIQTEPVRVLMVAQAALVAMPLCQGPVVMGAMLTLMARTVLQRAATVVMVVTPEALVALAARVPGPGLVLLRLMAPMETTHQAATAGPVASVV
jgi:hypothetical protein